MLIWSDTSISECPSCGATVVVGIMSLCITCKCGMYYVDTNEHRGWYFSREHFEKGLSDVPGPPKKFTNPDTGSVFTPDGIDKMLSTIIEHGKELTDWEEGFIADVVDYFNRTSKISEGQLKVLERIYVERTP